MLFLRKRGEGDDLTKLRMIVGAKSKFCKDSQGIHTKTPQNHPKTNKKTHFKSYCSFNSKTTRKMPLYVFSKIKILLSSLV